MTHALKTWPEYFQAVAERGKTFEVRKADRPFKVGETLLLQEWDNVKGRPPDSFSSFLFELPISNLYYRTFKIEYKERFPLSATALVFLTDGFHLMQWLAINFFTLSIAFALGDVLITFIWLRITVALVWFMLFEVILKKR